MSDQGERREPPLTIEDAPPADQQTQQLNVQDEQTLKFDKLGPVVVNNDGVRRNTESPQLTADALAHPKLARNGSRRAGAHHAGDRRAEQGTS